MINFKEDKDLMPLNHSCAHVMAQAVSKVLGRSSSRRRILL